MKQLPSELHPVVKITTETLVDPTPEPVIEIPEELRKAIAEAEAQCKADELKRAAEVEAQRKTAETKCVVETEAQHKTNDVVQQTSSSTSLSSKIIGFIKNLLK
jgi:1,6-anhydro-N-acetylmuramate kinase